MCDIGAKIQKLNIDPKKEILVVTIGGDVSSAQMDRTVSHFGDSLKNFNMEALNGLNILYLSDRIRLSAVSVNSRTYEDLQLIGRKLRL